MNYQRKANILRALSLISTTQAGSGHPTSCLSATDIITVLFDNFFHYDLSSPKYANNDRLIFSKGHAAPLYYASFALAGAFKRKDLLTLRKFKSKLEGHPTPKLEYVDVATGSLGQGLSVGCGMALLAKKEDLNHKTYVLLGDGEFAEGQIYEACNFASYYKLDNLIAIVDVNSLGQSGKTMFEFNTGHYEKILISLGFETKIIDGHNFVQIEEALKQASSNQTKKPYAIVCKTIKGKGVSFLEGRDDFHGKALSENDLKKALDELGLNKEKVLKEDSAIFNLNINSLSSRGFEEPVAISEIASGCTIRYVPSVVSPLRNGKTEQVAMTIGDEIATREAFGDALTEIGKQDKSIYVLDADVGNSTYTNKFGKEFPERFIQCFIAEQNMVSVALGLSSCGKISFVSSFGAFLERGYDQIRMAAVSGANIKFVGSHVGVSIGEDGPSQMALEDIGLFSAFPDSVVLQPCDGIACKKLVIEMANHKGISYLRTLRPKTKVVYNSSENFPIGGAKLLKNSDYDDLVVVASGITVFEALSAYEVLKKEGINICIIDAYSLKPFAKNILVNCLKKCKQKKVITVEDHYLDGGLGSIVCASLTDEQADVKKLGISSIPFSGSKNDLMHFYGIDSYGIIGTIKHFLKQKNSVEV